MIQAGWNDLKAFVDARSVSIQWLDLGGNYYLHAFDGPFELRCVLSKTLNADDVAVFEASYKAAGNKRLDPKDTDGSTVYRVKTTKVGWHYQPRYLTFTTAKYGSLHNKKIDTTTDYGDATLRFWKVVDGAWVELLLADYADETAFQAALATDCKITAIDWHSDFDFDIRGGIFVHGVKPTSPAWGYAVVAPDIPAASGGSVPFLDGGLPLHLLSDYGLIMQDAVTVKSFTADPVYKSNKIRLVIDHALGAQIDLAIAYQIYKL